MGSSIREDPGKFPAYSWLGRELYGYGSEDWVIPDWRFQFIKVFFSIFFGSSFFIVFKDSVGSESSKENDRQAGWQVLWPYENSGIHRGTLSFPPEMQCSVASPIFIIRYYIGHSMVISYQNCQKYCIFYKIFQISAPKRHDYHSYRKMLVRLIKNFLYKEIWFNWSASMSTS